MPDRRLQMNQLRLMLTGVIWPAVVAAGLSGAVVLAALLGADLRLTVPLGLAAVTAAILALRS
jgi:hypothetical protein